MADIRYNIYYSLSSTGPWTKANASPVAHVAAGNTFNIDNLKPNTQYYIRVVGGVQVDGTFSELIPQAIGPEEGSAKGIEEVLGVPFSIRTSAAQTHGGAGLSHQFEVI